MNSKCRDTFVKHVLLLCEEGMDALRPGGGFRQSFLFRRRGGQSESRIFRFRRKIFGVILQRSGTFLRSGRKRPRSGERDRFWSGFRFLGRFLLEVEMLPEQHRHFRLEVVAKNRPRRSFVFVWKKEKLIFLKNENNSLLNHWGSVHKIKTWDSFDLVKFCLSTLWKF